MWQTHSAPIEGVLFVVISAPIEGVLNRGTSTTAPIEGVPMTECLRAFIKLAHR